MMYREVIEKILEGPIGPRYSEAYAIKFGISLADRLCRLRQEYGDVKLAKPFSAGGINWELDRYGKRPLDFFADTPTEIFRPGDFATFKANPQAHEKIKRNSGSRVMVLYPMVPNEVDYSHQGTTLYMVKSSNERFLAWESELSSMDLNIKLNGMERDAVLAGLRALQNELSVQSPDQMILEIHTNGDLHSGLSLAQIDELCDRINTGA